MTRIIESALLATALFAGGALANAAAPTPAAPGSHPTPVPAAAGSNCTYYSDASHTTVVGRFGRDCCNNNVAWGVKTQFSSCSSACLICFPPPQD
jgi:hypothetical protein